MRIEKRITIESTPEAVFTYLADLPRHSEWASHPLKITSDSDGPISAGSKLTSNSHMMGKDNQDHLTVQQLLPNSKIVFEADGSAGKFVHEIQISDNGSNGCQVSKSMEVLQMRFPLVLMKPLLPMLAGKGLETDLKKIKANLEQK